MTTATTDSTAVILISTDRLQPACDNLRGPVGDVAELARSIAGIGVVEPLLVTPIEDEPDRYLIVAGHRRHAAAVRAGVSAVPCLVRSMTDAERIEVMLVENLQRSGIAPLAEASGYFRLVGEHGYTVRRMAKQVGRSERHVRARLALLELPAAAQDALEREELTVGQAEALLAAKDRPEVVEKILAEPEWRRRDFEQAVTDALRRAQHEDRRAALSAELAARGVRVVASEGSRPRSYVRLSELSLEEDVHEPEPCHAVVVESGYAGPSVTAVCTDRRRHSRRAAATDRSELQVEPRRVDPERQRAKEGRRLSVRRGEFATARLQVRLPKAPVLDFLVTALIDRANANDAGRAGTMLGLEARRGRYGDDWHGKLHHLAASCEGNRLRVGLAVAAAATEARIAASGFRNAAHQYLNLLTTLGYEPEPGEDGPPEGEDAEDHTQGAACPAEEDADAPIDAAASKHVDDK
jgi:ParB/RepB/Spo0J family partition protein